MPPKFDPQRCVIRKVWCGNGSIPSHKREEYSGNGTRYQCLQQGIGAGSAIERTKNLPASSLQHIKYVGPKHDQKFIDRGIRDKNALVRYARNNSANDIDGLLRAVLDRGEKGLDRRAYNSVLMFIYNHGVTNLPQCERV